MSGVRHLHLQRLFPILRNSIGHNLRADHVDSITRFPLQHLGPQLSPSCTAGRCRKSVTPQITFYQLTSTTDYWAPVSNLLGYSYPILSALVMDAQGRKHGSTEIHPVCDSTLHKIHVCISLPCGYAIPGWRSAARATTAMKDHGGLPMPGNRTRSPASRGGVTGSI